MILDRAATAQGGNGGATAFAAETGVSNEQIAAVERLLSLLDAIPVDEPSPDLVRRTLDRVAKGIPPMRQPATREKDEFLNISGPVA